MILNRSKEWWTKMIDKIGDPPTPIGPAPEVPEGEATYDNGWQDGFTTGWKASVANMRGEFVPVALQATALVRECRTKLEDPTEGYDTPQGMQQEMKAQLADEMIPQLCDMILSLTKKVSEI